MSQSNLSILIAEDDQVISELICADLIDYFGAERTNVDEVTSVKDALDRLKDNRYDIIVSDYYFEDHRADKGDLIRELYPQTPFIFISGGLPAGVNINQIDTYSLEKPFKVKDLHTTIERALNLH